MLSFDDYNKIYEYESPNSDNFTGISKNKIKEEYLKSLGHKGHLYKYIESDNDSFTFGMLKAIFHDALSYKKRREYIKGTYKFLHRIVPMVFAPIYYPIWVISWILGSSRALNKILVSVMKVDVNNYNHFLVKFVQVIMAVMEGEIKYVIGDDWFYDIFYVNKGLIDLIKQEHILSFAKYLADKMESKSDNETVPEKYIERELIQWINSNFNLGIHLY